MTPDDLAAIKARAEAATPGPWTVVARGGGLSFEVEGPPWGYREAHARREDAEFIAYARADIPALVAEVEHLADWKRRAIQIIAREHTEVERLRKALEGHRLRNHRLSCVRAGRTCPPHCQECQPCDCGRDEHNAAIDKALRGE